MTELARSSKAAPIAHRPSIGVDSIDLAANLLFNLIISQIGVRDAYYVLVLRASAPTQRSL